MLTSSPPPSPPGSPPFSSSTSRQSYCWLNWTSSRCPSEPTEHDKLRLQFFLMWPENRINTSHSYWNKTNTDSPNRDTVGTLQDDLDIKQPLSHQLPKTTSVKSNWAHVWTQQVHSKSRRFLSVDLLSTTKKGPETFTMWFVPCALRSPLSQIQSVWEYQRQSLITDTTVTIIWSESYHLCVKIPQGGADNPQFNYMVVQSLQYNSTIKPCLTAQNVITRSTMNRMLAAWQVTC